MGMFDDYVWSGPSMDRGPTIGEIWDRERRQQVAEEVRMLEDTKADAKAIWLLAEYYLPQDIKDAAVRWKMENTLQEIWRQAFVEGWRAAYRKANLEN
jgi:hypothetical protein